MCLECCFIDHNIDEILNEKIQENFAVKIVFKLRIWYYFQSSAISIYVGLMRSLSADGSKCKKLS